MQTIAELSAGTFLFNQSVIENNIFEGIIFNYQSLGDVIMMDTSISFNQFVDGVLLLQPGNNTFGTTDDFDAKHLVANFDNAHLLGNFCNDKAKCHGKKLKKKKIM